MGLVMYGGGVTQISGRIGGDVHARNKSGNYIRAGTKPTNPNTARQQAVRSAIAELCARWGNILTAVQRTAWNLYASNVAMKNRLGQTIFLSGFNHFIRSNTWLCRLGGTIIDAGPVVFELPAKDPAFSMSASEATQQITWGYDDTLDWANVTDSWLLLYQGQPQNPQRNSFGGPWRLCSQLAGVTGAPPASPLITGVVFAIAEGQRLWGYARILREDGRISEKFAANCFCQA